MHLKKKKSHSWARVLFIITFIVLWGLCLFHFFPAGEPKAQKGSKFVPEEETTEWATKQMQAHLW